MTTEGERIAEALLIHAGNAERVMKEHHPEGGTSLLIEDLREAAALLRSPVGEPVAWHVRWGDAFLESNGPWATEAEADNWVTRHPGFSLTVVPLYAAPPGAPEAQEPERDILPCTCLFSMTGHDSDCPVHGSAPGEPSQEKP